jgi:hypothetical protein
MPVNWYAALVIIVLVGVGSIALAKYNYNQVPAVVEPTVGTSWHAGLAFDICGTTEPALAASPSTATTGLTTTGSGVLLIAPKNAGEAGNNATMGKFAAGYSGLTLTNTALRYPSATPEYKNGQKCASGTPDAGLVGVVQARQWVISTKVGKNNEEEETGGVTTLKPANVKLLNRQLVTVGFGPESKPLPKPPASTILALQQVLVGGQAPVATTTTTAAGVTATTAPSVTTTTAPPATTTTKPSSTTTTK